MMRSAHPLLGLALALVLAGCGGSEGPTGPTYPDVTGTYSGAWTLQVEEQSSGQSAQSVCPGSITLSSQNQGSVSGSYIMEAGGDCDSSDSGNVSGTVRTDGAVSLGLSSPGGNASEFSELTGCTVTSGDSQMTGTITGTRLEVNASFFATCVFDGQSYETRWTLEFDG